MATNENLIPIPGRLHSVASEGHVTGADEIYDDTLQKDQATINQEVNEAIGTGGSVDSKISAAINALDASVSKSAGADGLALSVTEENGKLTAVSGSIAANTYDTYGSASVAQSAAISAAAADATTKVNAAKAEIKGSATSACDTLGEAEALIASEASRAGNAETALSNRITPLEAAVGQGGSIDNRISGAIDELDATASQTAANANGHLNLSVTEENGKITGITGSIDDAAYIEAGEDSAVIADFDPQTDTVWKKAQTLSNAEKSQVKTNLGLPQEIYSKTEVNELVSTPHQNYVTVATYSELPASGSTDTIYRISNYDGTQVEAGVYSEYAWSGSAYVFLAAKSSVGEVFDISEYHAGAKYADLAAALDSNNGGGVPQSLQKGGMSVKFVSNSDNMYVQYRYMGTDVTGDPNPFLDTVNWEKANYFLSEEEIQYNESENGALAIDGTTHYNPAIGEKRYVYQVEAEKFYKVVWAKAILNLDYMIVYVGDNDTILGYKYRVTSSAAYEIVNENLVLPTGTRKIVINSNIRYDAPQMDVISYFSIDDVLAEIADVADDVSDVANENKKQNSVLSSIKMVTLTKEIGYYYNASGEKAQSNICFCSNIAVSEGDVYYVTGVVPADSSYYLAVITDSNNNVLARIKQGANAGKQYVYNEKIIIPVGGAHLFLTSTYRNALARDLYAMSLKKEVPYSLAKNRVFDGKKVAMFGDSIFAVAGDGLDNRCLVDDFAEIVGGEVLNFGFGGTTMGLLNISDPRYAPFSMCKLAESIANNDWTAIDALSSFPSPYFYETVARLKATDFSQVDVVVMEQMTNDWANLRLEPTSDEDLGCYVGGLRHAIQTLQTAYPHLKIFVWSSVYRVLVDTTDNTFISDSNDPECSITASGKSLREWNERAKEVCEELNVTFVDNYNIGIGRYSYPAYFPLPDGTHPNAKGCARIAQSAASKMY